jgi:hypothetical protein
MKPSEAEPATNVFTELAYDDGYGYGHKKSK